MFLQVDVSGKDSHTEHQDNTSYLSSTMMAHPLRCTFTSNVLIDEWSRRWCLETMHNGYFEIDRQFDAGQLNVVGKLSQEENTADLRLDMCR